MVILRYITFLPKDVTLYAGGYIMSIQFDPKLLDDESQVPKYQLISQIIGENIRSGNLKPGDQLPPEPELIEMFNVSRITIRAAISNLVKKEIVTRKQGLGTFVRETQPTYRFTELEGFTKSCEMAGYSSHSDILSFRMEPVPDDIHEFLKVKPGDNVLTLLRLRYVNDIPCMYEHTYFSHKYLAMQSISAEELQSSLYQIFKTRFHIDRIEGRRYTNASFPNADEQLHLGLDPQTPIVRLTDLQFDSNGMPLFASRVSYDSKVFQWGMIFATKL